jgi:hypothetical protein
MKKPDIIPGKTGFLQLEQVIKTSFSWIWSLLNPVGTFGPVNSFPPPPPPNVLPPPSYYDAPSIISSGNSISLGAFKNWVYPSRRASPTIEVSKVSN